MNIRHATLTTNIKWAQPTPEEIREVLARSGWNQSEAARF